MKNIIKIFIICLIFCISLPGFAADVNIDDLAAIGAAPVSDDIYIINDTSAGATKSITTSYLFQYINAVLDGTNLEIGDGGTTDFTRIANDGEITLHGTARVTVDLYISASGVKAPGTKPATFVVLGLSGVWEFSDEAVAGNQETISGTLKLPTQMDKTVVPIFKIGWSADGISPGNCEWQLEYLYRSPGEATDAAAQATLTVTGAASATSNGFVITSFVALALPSATDQAMFFRIKRLSAVGSNDTIVDTVELRGMLFTHTRDKLGTGL